MLKNTHFTEEEVAICADAIANGDYALLDADLREHLSICDECAAEVLCVTDIAVNHLSKGKGNGKRVQLKSWLGVALGVAAAGLLFFFVTSLLTSAPSIGKSELATNFSSEAIDKTTDTVLQVISTDKVMPADNEQSATPTNAERPKIAVASSKAKPTVSASYVPDPTLEILYKNHTEAYRGESVTVISKGVLKISETDSLKWTNPAAEELIVELFNNEGDRIFTLTQNQSGMPIPKLSNGLYYWKLINPDFDLLFVGKILVE